MNSLILYWNSVWDDSVRGMDGVGQHHTAREHAAFNRALGRKNIPAPSARTRAVVGPPKFTIVKNDR